MGELVQFIFSIEEKTSSSIVRLILIFFGIGVLNYLFHIAWIRLWERLNLKRAQTYFKTNQAPVAVSDLLAGLRKARVSSRSIIYRRTSDFVQIKQKGGQIDNDALADILIGEQSRKASFSSYILGILIILGLVGTLRGLITAIVEVQPLLQDIHDLDQLPTISDALRQTLAGMNTAFVTTLAGLLTTLALGAVGWIFNREQSAFLTHFERFVSTEIIPRFTQTPETSIEAAVVQLTQCTDTLKFATGENVHAMRQAIQQLTDTSWGGQLEQQYILTNKFGETAENLLESLETIGEHQVLIEATVDSFKKLTTASMSQITEYHDTLRHGLEDSVPRLEEEGEKLKKAIEAYQRSQSKFIDDLSSTLQRQLQSITENQQGMVHVLTQLADELQIRSVLERQNQIFERIETQLTENQKEMVLVLSQSVLEGQNKLFDGIKTQLTESQQEIVGVLTQLTDELQVRSVLERQNQVFERIETQLTENQKEMVLVLSQSVLEGQNNLFDRIKTQLTESQQEIVGVLTQLTDELQIRSVLERQNQVFEGIESHLIENQQGIVHALMQLADELQIRSALEAQNKVFERIENHLIGHGDLVAEQKVLIQTLIANVQQSSQTLPVGTKPTPGEDSSHQILSQLLNQISLKLDTLNNTVRQPGIYRWISEIRRWFGGSR